MAQRTVNTAYGKLRGALEDEVVSYLGIPYARAPLAELRFCLPRPPKAWSGIRTSGEFGPIAPQPGFGLGSYVPGDPTTQDEDCLTLNIWAPQHQVAPCPVMVFFHGGSYLTGSGSGVMYRGAALARRGVAVVTFNYRLGALGFLAHPQLFEDEPSEGLGNWGLFDQLAALGWIRDNIAAFGGDAGRITCFGESAGAMSIADLLGSPLAEGLFHRAILQSGSVLVDSAGTAASTAERFRDALGLAKLSRRSLVGVPLQELLAAQVEASSFQSGDLMPFKPVIDGRLLPEHPARSIAKGASRAIDVMVGTNRDEFKFFSFAAPQLQEIDEEMLQEVVGGYVSRHLFSGIPPTAEEIISCYREQRCQRQEPSRPRDLLDAIATDVIFRLPSLRLAESRQAGPGRTYCYLFEWASPFAGGALGACHGLELPFVFNTLDNPVIAAFAGGSSDALTLADNMQRAWAGFASGGDPSHEQLGRWEEYGGGRRSTMVLGPLSQLQDAPLEIERRFWEDRLPRYGEEFTAGDGARPTVAPRAGA